MDLNKHHSTTWLGLSLMYGLAFVIFSRGRVEGFATGLLWYPVFAILMAVVLSKGQRKPKQEVFLTGPEDE